MLAQGWLSVEGRKLAGGVEMVIAILAVNKRNLTGRSNIYFSHTETRDTFCSQGGRLYLCPHFPSVLVRIASCCKTADTDPNTRITVFKERKGIM